MPIESWFPVPIYSADVDGSEALNAAMIPVLRRETENGRNHQPLVTGPAYSGSNAPDRTQYLQRVPDLAPLYRAIHEHASRFARQLELDLKQEHLYLGRSWVNILGRGGRVEPHNHMTALFSGAYYLQVPESGSVLRFTDPKGSIRRDPQYAARTTPFHSTFVDYAVQPGRLLLFPGWLTHGMPGSNQSDGERISVAFDYFSVSLSGQSPPPPPTGLVERLWRELDSRETGED